MNTEKKLLASYVALLLCAGTQAMALELNWNGDVMGAAKAYITSSKEASPTVGEPVPQNPSAASASAGVSIAGTPLGSTELQYERENRRNEGVSFRLNNHKDRVIAVFSNCDYSSSESMPQCDTKEFRIDGLTIDLQHKTVLLGSEVVGKFGGFLKGERLKNGWHLRAQKVYTTVREDSGGDYDNVTHVNVKVFLEK